MCGLAGFVAAGGEKPVGELRQRVERMGETLRHRGPDDAGTWVDPACGVALAHQRLAVIDLSPTGAQPMVSSGGQHVIVFNGEVYNHRAIRKRLESLGVRLKGSSDTEVLIEAIQQLGLVTTLQQIEGMFAFAVWDRSGRTLTLARDRMGEKPLYYGFGGDGTFLFGSELKALESHPSFDCTLDIASLGNLLGRGYIPGPPSIYEGISKLPPASLVTFNLADRSVSEPRRYWELPVPGTLDPLDAGEAIEHLADLLLDAVKIRTFADVPVGAFLSGGIDSSLIVALMQSVQQRPVRTFTIRFDDPTHDEADIADLVASHLGTDHSELRVTPAEALDVIPSLPALYDEPFADSSQIPTHLVARLARPYVTVALTGDGADEIFGGYDRYVWHGTTWSRIEGMPRPARAALRLLLEPVRRTVTKPVPAGPLRTARPFQRLATVARVLAMRGPDDLHDHLTAHWLNPEGLVRRHEGASPMETGGAPAIDSLSPLHRMMLRDQVTYLPDDILTKVDRASMGVALETRIPFLDRRVVELAARLPDRLKIGDGRGKVVLRSILARHVPADLSERPKHGFTVPVGDWLRGPLRVWAEDLLAERSLREKGILNPAPVRRTWQAHLDGADHTPALWTILMLQAWLDARPARQLSGRVTPRSAGSLT